MIFAIKADLPMMMQPGELRTVTVGPDVWIDAGARILTDVPQGTVVGAGAVVTVGPRRSCRARHGAGEGRDTPGGSRGVSQARERGTRAGATAGGRDLVSASKK